MAEFIELPALWCGILCYHVAIIVVHIDISCVNNKISYHIFTARKWSLRRLCFYTCLSVIAVHRGGLPQCMLGYPPRTRYPQEQFTIPSQDQAPPWSRLLPQNRQPLGVYTPHPPGSACWEIRSTSGRYSSYWNAILFRVASILICLEE